jgi:hypothetical protein
MADLYEKVLATVDHQTSPKQPDTVAEHALLTILASHQGYQPDAVRQVLNEAVEQGDLERTGDRYALPEN